MKASVATISLLLLHLLFITAVLGNKAESSRGPYHPTDCCFSYITHSVPHHWIRDYYKTSSECPKSGIIFITKKGHSICANPRDAWVRHYINDLEES